MALSFRTCPILVAALFLECSPCCSAARIRSSEGALRFNTSSKSVESIGNDVVQSGTHFLGPHEVMWKGKPWNCKTQCSWGGCCGDAYALGTEQNHACHHCACLADAASQEEEKEAIQPSCKLRKWTLFPCFWGPKSCPGLAKEAAEVPEGETTMTTTTHAEEHDDDREDNKPNSTVSLAGQCTVDDLTAMNALGNGNGDGSFPKVCSDCGQSSYHIGFTGLSMDEPKHQSCVMSGLREGLGTMGLSQPCAACYAKSATYGLGNCKSACFGTWCSPDCMDCVSKFHPDLEACTGFPTAPTKNCDDSNPQCLWSEWTGWIACSAGSGCRWKRVRSTLGKGSPKECESEEPVSGPNPQFPSCTGDVGQVRYCLMQGSASEQQLIYADASKRPSVTTTTRPQTAGLDGRSMAASVSYSGMMFGMLLTVSARGI
jgi:hypothetical protein